MAVGLSGNLRDFGIADVFQLIGQQRKTGELELRSGAASVRLVFDQGLIVSAANATGRGVDCDPVADRMVRCGLLVRERADEALAASRASAQSFLHVVVERDWVREAPALAVADLVTRDSIFEVLRWTHGSFDFRAQPVSHDRDRADLLGAEQILMDGLRMVDEWQSFAAQVPSEDTVFQRVGSFDRFAENAEALGPEELDRAERVFGLIDGRLTARRVIDLAQLSTFDGTRCLAELHQGGVIRPLHPEGLRQLRRQLRSADSGRVLVRRAAAALAPLLALAAVAWGTAASQASPSAPRPGIAIARPGLDGLREAFAARALHHAVGAYRLARGEWPQQPEDLEHAGLLAAVATPAARPYYPLHREQGTVFLAPER